MMNRRQMEQDIQSKKQPEVALPFAMNVISSDYYMYSSLQFAMNFYNYYEMTTEGSFEETDTLYTRIAQVVEKTLLSDFDGAVREEAVKELDGIRTEIIEVMQELTAFADRFAIYEYILNRLEKNFEKDLEDIDNDSTAKEIVSAIFSDKDQVLINQRIRLMLSQLPIRMTKTKFFDMLKDSLSIYEGSDKASVNDYIYMLRTAAGLKTSETEHDCDKECVIELNKMLTAMSKINAIEMTQAEHNSYTALLADAVEMIQSMTDRYFSLQEVVNSLYCLLLNRPYVSMEAEKEAEELSDIIKAICEAVNKADGESIEDTVVDQFEKTEGKLERNVANIQKDESLIDIMKESYENDMEAFMLAPQYRCLLMSKDLTSNSVFIELNKQDEEGKADKAYLESKYAVLVEEFEAILAAHHKLYNRAVIAAVLREMPVLFNSVDEVKDYVKNSLSGCKDYAEKAASVELFMNSAMEE